MKWYLDGAIRRDRRPDTHCLETRHNTLSSFGQRAVVRELRQRTKLRVGRDRVLVEGVLASGHDVGIARRTTRASCGKAQEKGCDHVGGRNDVHIGGLSQQTRIRHVRSLVFDFCIKVPCLCT